MTMTALIPFSIFNSRLHHRSCRKISFRQDRPTIFLFAKYREHLLMNLFLRFPISIKIRSGRPFLAWIDFKVVVLNVFDVGRRAGGMERNWYSCRMGTDDPSKWFYPRNGQNNIEEDEYLYRV